MKARKAVVLALCCAASALTAAPAAVAKPAPRSFYGVDPIGLPGQDQLVRAARGGVGTVRFPFSWPAIQSSPGAAFDWGQTDALIERTAPLGLDVLPILYQSPAALGGTTTLPVR